MLAVLLYLECNKSSLCCETQKKRNAHQHVRPTEYAAKTTTRSACGTLPPPLSLFPQAAQPFLHPLVPLKSTFLPPPRCNPRNISVLLPVPGLPMDRRKCFMFYPKIPHHHTATSLDMFLHCTHHRTKHALVGRLEVRVAILSTNKLAALRHISVRFSYVPPSGTNGDAEGCVLLRHVPEIVYLSPITGNPR